MPHKWYHQDCCGTACTTKVEFCLQCGERGIPQPGWRISWAEHMGRFVRTFGLKPIGPHVKLIGRVMKENFASCKPCHGVGFVDHTDPAQDGGCMRCKECSGSGYYFVGTLESFRSARDALLEQFPDARTGQEPELLIGARVE
jgi:hypothetical protein